MRTEIRMSSAPEAITAAWVWRVWDQGRLLARGQSASEFEAEQAVRTLTGCERGAHLKMPAVGI